MLSVTLTGWCCVSTKAQSNAQVFIPGIHCALNRENTLENSKSAFLSFRLYIYTLSFTKSHVRWTTTNISYSHCTIGVQAALLLTQLLANVPEKAAKDDPNPRDPAIYLGYQDGVHTIWGVNKQMKSFSFTHSLLKKVFFVCGKVAKNASKTHETDTKLLLSNLHDIYKLTRWYYPTLFPLLFP